ncbi:MAG: hypothetical protein U5J64_07060 [Halobacteriales archaeon]|nr:hypothetical protein [Halobacteriales archaeon]
MTQTVSIDGEESGSARVFFDSTADLVTAKGVVLLLFLTGITVASIATGEAVEGVLPGAFLAAVLVGAVVYEDVRNGTVDVVGVVAVVLAVVYTGLEYVSVSEGLWFPLGSAFLLLSTAGIVAWRKTDDDDPAKFVDGLDIVGLHGGILFVLYALLYIGLPTELLTTQFLPAVFLFFVLSLLGTTVAYGTRSPSMDVDTDELHHRLVSVVRDLNDIEDNESHEKLGQHVRSVAQALSGVQVPSRVEVSDGRVPVVLPVSGEPVYESHDVDDLLKKLKEKGLTGYAVHEDGNVLLVKNGEPVVYYVAPKDEFGTSTNVLPYGYFSGASVYTSAYAFVDAVKAVLPTEETEEDAEEWTDEEEAEDELTENTKEKEGDEDESEESGQKTEPAFEDDVDINKKLDDAGDMFD